LIVWDRLFGTFAREGDEPVYGITKPLRSFNALWANLDYWSEMWSLARRSRRPLDRRRVLWKRPGWRPDELGGYVPPPEVERATYAKHDAPAPRAVRLYVLAQFVIVNLAAVACLRASGRMDGTARVAAAALLVGSLLSLGGLLDRRPWAPALEAARLLAACLVLALVPGSGWVAGAAAFAMGASLLWLKRGLPLPAEVR
jgi:hypothetical protein